MKKFLALAFILLTIAACQQKQEQSPHSQEPTGAGQLLEEIPILEDAVKRDPGNADAWISLGNARMDSSRFSGAIDAYQKALDIDPKNVNVRVDMGICYRNVGKSDMAVKEFREAIKIDPKHVNARKNLAIVLAYDMRDNAQAIKEFEKAIELAPGAQDVPRMKMEIERLKTGK